MSVTTLAGFRAVSAVHPGAGAAPGALDLPLQREPHTRWPVAPASAVKGTLRAKVRERIAADLDIDLSEADRLPTVENPPQRWLDCAERLRDASQSLGAHDGYPNPLTALFGPAPRLQQTCIGALAISDLRILALPVRAGKHGFAWLTSPGVLHRYGRDTKEQLPIPAVNSEQGFCSPDAPWAANNRSTTLLLEEYSLRLEANSNCTEIASAITRDLGATIAPTADRLIVVDDTRFTDYAILATVPVIHNALDYSAKTALDQGLFDVEMLPPETVLYGSITANQPLYLECLSRLLECDAERHICLQIGAGVTTGCGFGLFQLGVLFDQHNQIPQAQGA